MTYITDTHPPKSEVFGAYSQWPRRVPKPRRRALWVAASASVAGVFVHCVLPMIAGA